MAQPLLNPNPVGVQDQIDALPAPEPDLISTLGDPRILAVDPEIVGMLGQMRERLRQIETGMFAIVMRNQTTPPDFRGRLDGMLAFIGARAYRLILDLPDDVEKATRLFIHQLPEREADRMLVTALTVVQGQRIEHLEARIRELELDLQATRTDAPVVKL
jgi:hypothetical protein